MPVFSLGLAIIATIPAEADQVKKKGRDEIYSGEIKQVHDDGSVEIDVLGLGEITLLKTDIEWAKVDRPPALAEAAAAMDAQQYIVAAQSLKPIVERLLGLPEQADGWVGNAALWLGECYLQLKDWKAADELFQRIKKRYPANSATWKFAEAGRAQTLVGLGQYEAALKVIGPLLEPAKKTLAASAKESPVFARLYLAEGDCHAANKNWKEALTSYLTVVALYYHDKAVLNEARSRAAQMYEELSDWARAVELYNEVLKEGSPKAGFIEGVKKRLALAQEKLKQSNKP